MVCKDLLMIGNRGGSNVGESFERAARSLHLDYVFLNANDAMSGPPIYRKVFWHLLGRRPVALRRFSKAVLDTCREVSPRVLLTTGMAPIDASTLSAIGKIGIKRCSFLTDDPWSESARSSWFLRALKQYDFVFNPRQLARADLESHTKARVIDLPFGLDPELFHAPRTYRGTANYASDVFFAGGADHDRVPYIAALRSGGLSVGVYGSYWERFAETRDIARGRLTVEELPHAIAAAKVGLCLVRRANRDEHCMRTFELPAVGCCMLVEDTDDHRKLFGPEGRTVLYFSEISEMVSKAQWLVQNDAERKRLAEAAHAVITAGRHTYRDRLETILNEIAARP
jgi:spore maturation protein CgeB